MEQLDSAAGSSAEAAAQAARRHGWAWIGLCAALAVHVTDEALTDFLSVYNPAVRVIRQRLPYLPLPVFTFKTWLTGLIVAVILLTILSVFAFRGSRWIAPLSYLFGLVMLGNGLGHLAASVYSGHRMPGVYSAPLLVAGSICLLVIAHQQSAHGAR